MLTDVKQRYHLQVDPGAPTPPEPITSSYEDAVCSEKPQQSSDPKFLTEIGDGMILTVTDNLIQHVRGHTETTSNTKDDVTEGDYKLGAVVGGISITAKSGTLGIWGSQNVSIEADNSLGLISKEFGVTSKGQGYIVCDGDLEIGAQEIHMN